MQKPTRYSGTAQALHWVMAILVLLTFIYGPGGSEERVYSAARDFDRQLHETLGLAVFVLLLVRVWWRLVDERPEPAPVARWMGFASRLVQALLYLLMLALPLTAIVGAWLEGHALTFLAGVEIAPWVAKNHELGARIATLHTWLGNAIMWLAGLHALAGLYHHFVRRDGVLVSMLPRWLMRSPR